MAGQAGYLDGLYDAEGILASKRKNKKEDEVLVKWAGYHCKEATWEIVPAGTNPYGPRLGVHYGFVDEAGFHAPRKGKTGGILGVRKPQLAQNSHWGPAVQKSVKEAAAKRAVEHFWSKAKKETWLKIVRRFKEEGINVRTPFSDVNENNHQSQNQEDDEDDPSQYLGLKPAPLSKKKEAVARRIPVTSAPQDPIGNNFEDMPGMSMPMILDDSVVFPDGSVWS